MRFLRRRRAMLRRQREEEEEEDNYLSFVKNFVYNKSTHIHLWSEVKFL